MLARDGLGAHEQANAGEEKEGAGREAHEGNAREGGGEAREGDAREGGDGQGQ